MDGGFLHLGLSAPLQTSGKAPRREILDQPFGCLDFLALEVTKATMGAVKPEGQLLTEAEVDHCLLLWIISCETALALLFLL